MKSLEYWKKAYNFIEMCSFLFCFIWSINNSNQPSDKTLELTFYCHMISPFLFVKSSVMWNKVGRERSKIEVSVYYTRNVHCAPNPLKRWSYSEIYHRYLPPSKKNTNWTLLCNIWIIYHSIGAAPKLKLLMMTKGSWSINLLV